MIRKSKQSNRTSRKSARSTRCQQKQGQLNYDNLEHRQLMATLVGNNTVTYQDVDGDAVTVAFSGRFLTAANVNSIFRFGTGSVSGSNATPQQLRTINLSGLSAAARSSITVSAIRSGAGNGLAHVGQILATGLDLGNVTINGDLGRIRSGDTNARTRGLGVLSVHSLGDAGTVTGSPNLETEVAGSIRGVNVTNSVNGAYIRTEAGGNIDAISIGGSIVGNSLANSGAIYSSGNIGDVSLGGSIFGSSGLISGSLHAVGNIGNVTMAGSLFGSSGFESGSIDASRVGSLSIGGSLFGNFGNSSGSVTATSVGPISLGGSINGGNGQASGSIRSVTGNVTIAGSIVGSSGLGSGNLEVINNRANVTINGSVVGGSGEASGYLGGEEDAVANRVIIAGRLQGGSGFGSGRIGMALNSLNIGQSILGSTGSESGAVIVGNINDLTVGGDIVGGNAFGTSSLVRTGFVRVDSARTITVGGNLVAGFDGTSGTYTFNGAIVAKLNIENLVVRGNVQGNPGNPFLIQARGQESPRGRTDLAFGTISINGNVTRAKILVGADVFGINHNADAQVSELRVGGSWTASDFLVGVYHAGGGVYRKYAGTGVRDRATVTSSVGRISITGSIIGTSTGGDHYGFVSEHILNFTRGVTPFLLTSGKSNDTRLLDTVFADVHMLEV